MIQLSLKSAKRDTFQSACAMLMSDLAGEFSRHSYVLSASRLAEKREQYLAIMREKADLDSYSKSLKFLSECLHIYHENKVVILKSNREGGTGRTDLFVRPVSRRRTAYVVEFKKAGAYRELGAKAEEALVQIEEKKYDRELVDDGYESVVRYGIAFFGKDCEVRSWGINT